MSAARPHPPARPDAAYALRGLVPTGLTVLVLVATVVGARVGAGVSALLAAGAVLVGGLALMLTVALSVRTAAHHAASGPAVGDLGAEWARVEPAWSGRR